MWADYSSDDSSNADATCRRKGGRRDRRHRRHLGVAAKVASSSGHSEADTDTSANSGTRRRGKCAYYSICSSPVSGRSTPRVAHRFGKFADVCAQFHTVYEANARLEHERSEEDAKGHFEHIKIGKSKPSADDDASEKEASTHAGREQCGQPTEGSANDGAHFDSEEASESEQIDKPAEEIGQSAEVNAESAEEIDKYAEVNAEAASTHSEHGQGGQTAEDGATDGAQFCSKKASEHEEFGISTVTSADGAKVGSEEASDHEEIGKSAEAKPRSKEASEHEECSKSAEEVGTNDSAQRPSEEASAQVQPRVRHSRRYQRQQRREVLQHRQSGGQRPPVTAPKLRPATAGEAAALSHEGYEAVARTKSVEETAKWMERLFRSWKR